MEANLFLAFCKRANIKEGLPTKNGCSLLLHQLNTLQPYSSFLFTDSIDLDSKLQCFCRFSSTNGILCTLLCIYVVAIYIKGAVMCISIVNRLNGDQIETPKKLLKSYEMRPLKAIIQVFKN